MPAATAPWPGCDSAVFRLIPREERFFDLFEEQGRNIVAAAGRLREMIFDFSDAPAKAMAIKELEHAGDVLTHDLIRKINTDRKSTRLNSSHIQKSRMPSSA